MDSDGCADRLPSDLWDKIVPYLLINRAFYSNPVLLDVLQEMPETWPAFHRHKHKWLCDGYTPEFLARHQAGPLQREYASVITFSGLDVPDKTQPPRSDCYKFGPCADIYRVILCGPRWVIRIDISLDGYVLIHEKIILANPPMPTDSAFEKLRLHHARIHILPYGIQIITGSPENPWERSILFPDEDVETGFLKMRIVPIQTVNTQKIKEYYIEVDCYSIIPLLDLFPVRDIKTYARYPPMDQFMHMATDYWIPFMNLLGYAKGTPVYEYLVERGFL